MKCKPDWSSSAHQTSMRRCLDWVECKDVTLCFVGYTKFESLVVFVMNNLMPPSLGCSSNSPSFLCLLLYCAFWKARGSCESMDMVTNIVSGCSSQTSKHSLKIAHKMSAIPFFRPPHYAHRRLPNSVFPHNTDCFLPQNFGRQITILRFCGPLSWYRFDTVRPTIARNEVLEKIIDAGGEARILDCLMARTSACFYRSFDVLFPGQGVLACNQDRTVCAGEVDRICDDFARVLLISDDARYQLTLQWTEVYEQMSLDYDRSMKQSKACLEMLRRKMEDPILQVYARVNAVFHDWWMDRFDEVNKLEELLNDPEVMVAPTIMKVLTEISYQVPLGDRVRIVTKIDTFYRTLCILTTGDVQLADNGQVLAEVEQLSSGPDVGLLLQNLAI